MPAPAGRLRFFGLPATCDCSRVVGGGNCVDANATSFTVLPAGVRYTAVMRVKLPRRIQDAIQIGVVLSLIPMICAPFLIGGAEVIYRLKFGQWPDWSPLARGWWNPAEHPTGWAGLDRVLDTIAGSNVVGLSFLILMAFGAYTWVEGWRERRAFEHWHKRRVLTRHTIGGRPARTGNQ
jgi:hypothetical protein